MPVFETFPYTNFHELNLDWMLKELKEFGTMYDAIPEEIDKYITAVGTPHFHTTNGYYIYVCGTTGDDKNDGLVPDRPVKTLGKALDIMNGHAALAHIYLEEPGEYLIPYRTIASCELHIIARAGDITINWMDDDDSTDLKTFYNCYLHFGGYTDGSTIFHISGTGTDTCYIEGGKIYAKNITFTSGGCNFGTTGAAATFVGCTFMMKTWAQLGCVNFSGCTFWAREGASGSAALHIGASCVAGISSSVLFREIDENVTPYCVEADRAYINLTGNFTGEGIVGNPYVIKATRCSINGNQSVVQSWMYAGLVENCEVLSKWYATATEKAGYDTIEIIDDAVKNTRYETDPNAKSLTFKMELLDNDDAVVSRGYWTLDLGAVDTSATKDFTSAPFIYDGPITSNVPYAFYIKGDTFQNGDVRYNHSQASSLDTTSSTNTDVFNIRVAIYQNF